MNIEERRGWQNDGNAKQAEDKERDREWKERESLVPQMWFAYFCLARVEWMLW